MRSLCSSKRLWVGIWILAFSQVAPGPRAGRAAEPAAEKLSALRIQEGAVASNQIVGLGRDVVVEGEARSEVAAIGGSVEVKGTVQGDVIVLGGDVRLSAGARVEGEVFVLGGRLEASPEAFIGGRAVSYPSASSAWLTLLEGPALGLSATNPALLALKAALLSAWLLLLMLLFAVSGKQVQSTAQSVADEPFRNFWMGLVGVATLVLTTLFLATFAGPLISFPLVCLVVLVLLMAKLWGVVAVFHALGLWCFLRFGRRPQVLEAASLGLVVLGILKFFPYVGAWVWTIATLIGVGAALTTKFGRREAWFENLSTLS